MISDEKDDNDLELEDSISAGEGNDATHDEDIIDLDTGDEDFFDDGNGPLGGLSAGDPDMADMEDDFVADLDVDITGDEDIDFAGEEEKASPLGGVDAKKMALPALIVVAALGVGGYIVMNPQILGGGATISEPAVPYIAQADPETNVIATEPPQETPSDVAQGFGAGEEAPVFAESLPQPTVTRNEVPRPPSEVDMVDDITEGGVEIVDNEIPAFPEQENVIEITAPVEEPAEELAEAEMDLPASDSAGESQVQATETVAAEPAGEMQEIAAIEEAAGQADPVDPAEEAEELSQNIFELTMVEDTPAEPEEALATPPAEEVPVLFEETPEAEMAQSGEAQGAPAAEPAPATGTEDRAQGFGVQEFEVAQNTVQEAPGVTPPAMPAQKSEQTNAASGQAAQTQQGVASAPVTRDTVAPAADTYYDGLLPTGPMAATGPRKVDPELEPASQFVIVKKTNEASDMEALLVAANRALKLKRYESALEMFNQLHDKNSRDPRILMGLAVAQQNVGLSESAIQTYETILDINPNNADAMLNMLGLLRLQYPSVALRRLLALQEKHPNNAGIAAQIGVTYADLGHADDALRYLGMAASQEPNNAQHYFNMAIIADREGQTDNAIEYYQKALQLDAIYSSGRSIPRETVYDRLATLRRR